MRLQLLGPLEVVDGNGPLPLSGIKQRATLGYLLLHTNRVVPTSQLLQALWGDEVPATARKMLQNAVSGLRRVLSATSDCADPVVLLTHAPGYLLRVEPHCVDLHAFRRLVEEGRQELLAGSPEPASQVLQEALGMWRGPVLADLVETGITWPELSAIRNERLAAQEDYFEATLASGRHHEAIGEFETLVETEPPRERLCNQLMRALYRCGRQADALSVYRRTRTRLIDELGLEPGRELQELERAILRHDPALDLPTVQPVTVRSCDTPEPHGAPDPSQRQVVQSISSAPSMTKSRTPRTGHADRMTEIVGRASAATARAAAPAVVPARPEPAILPPDEPAGTAADTALDVAAERKQVSVVMVLAQVDPQAGDDDPEDVDEALRGVAAIISEEAERFGGVLGGAIGPVWSVLFGVAQAHEDDAVRAVRAALAIRDRFVSPGRTGLGAATAAQPTARVTVCTGEALVPRQAADRSAAPQVAGGIQSSCMRLMVCVPSESVRVCDLTREASEAAIIYRAPDEPSTGWEATAVRHEPAACARPRVAVPFIDRDHELDLLGGLLDKVRGQRRPYLVTVLGEPGIGKSRLVAEFVRAVESGRHGARCLTGRTPSFGGGGGSAALAEIVASCIGAAPTDSAATVDGKLTSTVHRLSGPGKTADWMLSQLRPLVSQAESAGQGTAGQDGTGAEAFPAWQRFLEETAAQRPLVMVVEDLHWADETVLRFVDDLTEGAAPVPLLVIATARTELLERRPTWGGGKLHATTITLDPLSDAGISRLVAALWSQNAGPGQAPSEPGESHGSALVQSAFPQVVAHAGGNPLFALECARTLRGWCPGGSATPRPGHAGGAGTARRPGPPLPRSVHNVIAAQLDSLPIPTKAVLYDAAVLGYTVWSGAMAAMGERAPDDIAPCLDYLERHKFLLRSRQSSVDGETEYVFRHVLVRDVAYAQLPRAARARKHQLAAGWIEGLPVDQTELLAHHRRQAVPLALRWPAHRRARARGLEQRISHRRGEEGVAEDRAIN